jgi:hypothetical protein
METPMSPTKMTELGWPSALKGLTPGNIKKTASDFMKEWEKSLATPPTADPARVIDTGKQHDTENLA